MSQTPVGHADRFVSHDGVYLLSHSVGLPVAGNRAAIDDYLDVWESDPAGAWPRWLDAIEGFRSALAQLLGGDRASICPQGNVSSALTKILGSLRDSFGSRSPTILLTEDAFPSLGYVCQHSGYDVRYIARTDDVLDLDVWADHLDAGVDIVLATHVHSNTGELIPAHGVVEIAGRRGIISIVDAAQSVGVIPIDVAAWHADFIIGSCVKWLSGGPGAGWLWADAAMIDRCTPTDVGWFSHADPFEFDIHDFRYADDALRFWGGTPTVLPFAVARHAIETINEIGVETIRRINLDFGDVLIDRLGDLVISPHQHVARSGTCVVTGDLQLAGALHRARIEVDHRSTGIRLSPHAHNTREQIEHAASVIESWQGG